MPAGWIEERGFVDAGDHRLRCALARPSAEGAHPAALLLPPLGARSCTAPLRDAPPNDGLAALLAGWADAGLVVLRVDPSGVGESGGPPYDEAPLAADLEGHRAALAHLASLPFVDRGRIFLLGASLGGALAPVVAEGADVAGIVVLGAPSRRWSACLADSARRQLALAGVPDEVRDREAAHAARLHDLVLRRGESVARAFHDHPDLARCRAAGDYAGERLHGRAVGYFRALDAIDPEAAWRRVRAPVLAVHGEHDWIVADDDHTRIAAWVAAAGGVAAALTLPGVDHDLCRHPSRAASFASRGKGAPDPRAAAETLAWVRAGMDDVPAFTRASPAGHTARP